MLNIINHMVKLVHYVGVITYDQDIEKGIYQKKKEQQIPSIVSFKLK